MKILILRLSSLGDIVLTQPFCSELRRLYPDSEIHYLCKSSFTEIVDAFGCVDNIIPYHKSLGFHMLLLRNKYDLVIDLHSKFATWLLSWFVPTKRLLRYNKEHSRRKKVIQKHLKTTGKNTVAMYFSAFPDNKSLGLMGNLPYPRLFPKRFDSKMNLRTSSKPLIAVFPGATHATKMLPIATLRSLINKHSSDYDFIVLGSEQERALGEKLFSASGKNCRNLCGVYSLAELLGVIDETDLVLSNDSGPMHLAAALEKTQIACFGATHPSLGFGPLNHKANLVVKNLPCQPCSLHGGSSCPAGHFACMQNITVDELSSLIESLIS